MPKPLAKRTKLIEESPTLKVSARAGQMIKEGIDVVNFGVGEPDFDTPVPICDAGVKAIRTGKTRYTPVPGIPDLKAAIAKKLKEDNGLDYEPANVVVSCGAKHSLFNVILSIVEEGDEVIIPAPYWVSYPDMVKYALGKPVFVDGPKSKGFLINAKDLRAAITPKTKAIILNSPSNPTGGIYNKEQMGKLAEVIAKAGIWCLSDEIYEKLLYDGAKHVSIASFPGMKDITVTVNGHSKAFAMTGWRIGYIASTSKELVKAVSNLQSQSTSNPATPCQYAALTALTDPVIPPMVEIMRQEFEKRRDLIVKLLNAIPGVDCPKPGGAFYVFPDVSAHYGKKIAGVDVKDSMVFAEVALEKGHIAIVPGGSFGNDKCVRFSYACSMQTIEKGVKRLADLLKG